MPDAIIREISLKPQTDPALRRYTRVIAMVSELHKAGYQRIRLFPALSPNGSYLRAEITFAANTKGDGFPIDYAWVARYSTGDGSSFFGWPDAADMSARQLAVAFLERFPEIACRGRGRDWAYAGWLLEVLGQAEAGEPIMLWTDGDFLSDEHIEHWTPPPVIAETQPLPPLHTHIPNEALTLEVVPESNFGWDRLEPFCTYYDGYDGGRRTIAQCGDIAQRVFADMRNASMDDLRIALFFQQRKIRWNDQMPVQAEDVNQIRPVIEEIRQRVVSRAVGDNSNKPWLNSFDVIDGIVRRFTSDVLNNYALIAPEWPIDKFIAWAQAECDRYNHLFLTYGLSPDTDYTRGVWNTPKNLGCFILSATGINGDASKGVRDAFMQHVLGVTNSFLAHHSEPVEEWVWKLDALMEDLIANLLGFQEYDFDQLNGYRKAADDITSDQKAASS